MFLSRFHVRGYKCLEDVDVALTPMHVLIGPGDSGKTSLLEAISAFYGRLKTPATQWFPATDREGELVTQGNRVPAIDLAGQWSEAAPAGAPLPVAGYGYSIAMPLSKANFSIMDQWLRPLAGKTPQAGLTLAAIPFPRGTGPLTAEDRATQATFRDTVQKMLQPAPVYRLDPRRLAETAALGALGGGPLAADGFGLPLLLDEIARRHAERFAEITAAFCRMVPQYRNVCLPVEWLPPKRTSARRRKPGPTGPVEARGLIFETRSGQKLAARDASPGSLLLLGMLALTRMPEPPTILLIENPEQGLYPLWLSDLMEPLRQTTSQPAGRPCPQIIFTTHSPTVLNFFPPEEVTLLARPSNQPDGPTIARPLQGMDEIRQQVADGNARLGELWGQFLVASLRLDREVD